MFSILQMKRGLTIAQVYVWEFCVRSLEEKVCNARVESRTISLRARVLALRQPRRRS